MSFTQPLVLFVFLPAVFALYFPIRAIEDRRAASGARSSGSGSTGVLFAASVAFIAIGVFNRSAAASRWFVPFGLGVIACHAIAYLVDLRRGEAEKGQPQAVALYLLQFPLLPAGPIVRYRDFCVQLSRRAVSMSAFGYGVRRFVTGFIKVVLIAGTLGGPTDKIFALPAAKLSADAAWLAAVCGSLQIYFVFGGYSDMAIGLGRMFGFRYQENFRRPYTADSVREFWRRWNITLITWLRDYLFLPIAGQDRPTARLYVNIIAGFCLVGLWHGAGFNAPIWGLYFGTLLAVEAVGAAATLRRLPVPLRHAYVLCAVAIGWVILRAGTASAALTFLKTMAGVSGLALLTAHQYLTPQLWMALGAAVLGAGPMIPSISRWRVSVDAATTSALMMLAATVVFIWRPIVLAVRSVWPTRQGEIKN